MKFVIAAVVLSLGLAGCASTPPDAPDFSLKPKKHYPYDAYSLDGHPYTPIT